MSHFARKKDLTFLGLFLLFSVLPLYSQANNITNSKTLLFLDLRQDPEVTPSKHKELNEYLQKEIKNTNAFDFLDSGISERVIEEEMETLKGCENTDCAIIIGEKANADLVLDGFIKKKGNGNLISVQIINPKTKKVEFNESFTLSTPEKYKEEMEDFRKYLITYSKGEKIVKQKPKWPYIWRSMVLPGWGQYEDGRTRKAYLYGGAFLGLGLLYLKNANEFKVAKQNYDSVIPIPATPEQDTFAINYFRLQNPKQNYQKAEQNVNLSLYLLSALYLWNVFDAGYYSGKEPIVSPSVSFNWKRENNPVWGNIGTYYEFTYSFRY